MKLDTKLCCIWFEEYSVAWFENIVLNLLEEFIGQSAPEGRCSPFGGGILCETGNE